MHRSAAEELLAVLLLLTGVTHAQISGLAPTDDGSVLYSATPFNLAGSTETASHKIYILAVPALRNETATISSNGRFALIPGPALADLTTGVQTANPKPSIYGSLLLDSVASDGTVLLTDTVGQALALWRQDPGMRQIAPASGLHFFPPSMAFSRRGRYRPTGRNSSS